MDGKKHLSQAKLQNKLKNRKQVAQKKVEKAGTAKASASSSP